jgi:hypothetical protein
MGELKFTPEPGAFWFSDSVTKTVDGKKKSVQLLVPISVTRASCPSPKFTALVYSTRIHEDLDGAPDAYGANRPGDPLQSGLHPREKYLANATAPHKHYEAHSVDFQWVGVVSATRAFASRNGLKIDDRPRYCAKAKKNTDHHLPGEDVSQVGAYPVVQQTGVTRGYYVSKNNLHVNPQLPEWDQARYGDPTKIAFAVRTGCWNGKDVHLGDIGWSVNCTTGNDASFIFGDSNRSNHLGECSNFLVRKLFGGHAHGPGTFILFPGMRGGAVTQVSQGQWDNRVRAEITKLNDIGNGVEFAQFLSVRADLALFAKNRANTPFNTSVLAPLAKMGYNVPMGDFLGTAATSGSG